MEKHSCKLCFKTFSNGRALGGHMRSHLINLPVAEERTNPPLDHETESAPSASLSEEDEGYGHPKQSIHHREVSFFRSVVLQDRESETESSKNPTRRRSKRIRKSSSRLLIDRPHDQVAKKKGKFFSQVATESWAEPEPVSSSISDVTTEEDVAFCLMMMSRDDNWKKTEHVKFVDQKEEEMDDEEEDQEEEEEEEDTDESEELEISKLANNKSRGKYRCETCSRTFRSYQALGGHRASHRKSQVAPPTEVVVAAPTVKADSKVHQCPYCFRVFASGQALGGHKRSHAANYASTTLSVPEGKKVIAANPSSSLIDLNLPATMDDDESGQVEVSDAEFIIDRSYRYLKQSI